MTTRGIVVPLTPDQVVKRALYLAGKAKITELDDYVVRGSAPEDCPALYYLLTEHNGGKDPTASDPADRWSNTGSTFVNRTCDCSGGNSWMHGFDRYQPQRFSHLYDGWINTDSKIYDARRVITPGSHPRCFEDLGRPEPGAIVTCLSGSPGHKVGHEGCVVTVPAEWDPTSQECWDLVGVVDVSARGAGVRANNLRTAHGWFGTGAMFLRSVMSP